MEVTKFSGTIDPEEEIKEQNISAFSSEQSETLKRQDNLKILLEGSRKRRSIISK